MRPVSLGRALRLGACGTAAAGLVAVVCATPAFAADTLWINAPSELVLPAPVDGGEGESRTAEVGIYHDVAGNRVTDGRLTVDVSDLAGVARVTWPEQCEVDGTTAVCAFPEVSDDPADTLGLEIRAVEGAEAGATGEIAYTATAKGADSPYQPGDMTTSVTVGAGPDLVLGDVPPKQEAEKGVTAEVPFSVANHGNETADGAILWIHASHGLEFAQRFSNCDYTGTGGGEDPPATEALCVVDRPLEPGTTYVPDAPLALDVTDRALYERADLRVEPKSAEALERARGGRVGTEGTGGTLRLVERPSPKSDDLNTDDNYAVTAVTVDNTADFELTGAAVDGAAGETVTAEVRLRNRGPAWVADLFTGDSVVAVDVRVPEGTTVTGVPENCSPQGPNGEYVEERTGASRYVCGSLRWMAEDGSLTFPFELRIDEVVPNATGELTVLNGTWVAEYDPETGNNTAALVVNGDGTGDGTGDGDTPDDGDGTPNEGEETGGDGDADGGKDAGGKGDGDTSGGGDGNASTGGSGTDSGSGGTGAGDGALALTGAGGATLLGGLAALAVAIGGGLVLIDRRRARA